MSGINKMIIVGRVGKQPETIKFENGSVTKITVAVSEKYKNKSGEAVESTEWFNVVTRNKLAEIVDKYVTKGILIYIEGKIKTRSYEKDGQKHYVTEVVADTMQMLSKGETKRDQETTPGYDSSAPMVGAKQNPVSADYYDAAIQDAQIIDDDLPF